MGNDLPFQTCQRLLGYLAPSRGRIALVLAALGLNAGAMLLIPWVAKGLFRDAVLDHRVGTLYSVLGLLLGLLLLVSSSRYVADTQIESVSLRLVERVRLDLVAKLLRLPYGHFVRSPLGDSVSRAFNDAPLLKDFLFYSCFAVGSDLLSIGGAVAILFCLSWRLSLVLLLVAVVGGAVTVGTARWVRRRSHHVQATLAEMTSLLAEQVGAIATIQAFGAAGHEWHRFAQKARAHCRAAVVGKRLSAGSRVLVAFISAVGVMAVVGFGAREVMAGRVSNKTGLELGQLLVAFVMYALLILEPLTRLSKANLEIQRALAAGRRLFELIDLPEAQAELPRLAAAPRDAELGFDAVHFHYHPGEPVLTGLDLTIRPGETVALVGPSGTGKSTLAALVLRLYDPVRGRVLLGGRDLRDLDLAGLRRRIGWAGQDTALFRGTIADNIRYGTWDARPEAVEAAARLACADRFIRELPRGSDSRIGDRGVDLSGGQRARLALARVILRSPPLVILDEITASLDTETEARLWEGLAGWMAGRTTLIIAHRLTTVLGCPRVVVLEGGRVRGDGPADLLRHSCPTFHNLFVDQMHPALGAV
jgi:ABC-type multidrug transport system fused ATPase/permease subunit